MAQFAGESHISVAAEGFTASVPPTFASTPFVPLVTLGFHPLVPGAPQLAVGHWQTYAPLDLVIESILMTHARASEAPLTPLSQGYVVIVIPPAAATFAIGSQSLESGPPLVLHFSVPTDESPELQYQHLMETAHTL